MLSTEYQFRGLAILVQTLGFAAGDTLVRLVERFTLISSANGTPRRARASIAYDV